MATFLATYSPEQIIALAFLAGMVFAAALFLAGRSIALPTGEL